MISQCSQDESIVRAVRSSDWDEKKNRWSSSLFVGPNTSVSRLGILSLDKTFDIFLEELHKPPVHKVIAAGEITVGAITEIGNAFTVNGKEDPREITVIADPIKDHLHALDNPAHALIVEKIPRMIAFDIIKSLKFHKPETKFIWVKKIIGILGLLGTSIRNYITSFKK